MDKKPLLQKHLNYLAARWVDEETAKRHFLFYADDATAAAILGKENSFYHKYGGIGYNVFHRESVAEREVVIRLDEPEMERKSNGEEKPKNKYAKVFGKTNQLMIPPNTPKAFFEDRDLPVAIFEGCNQFIVGDKLSYTNLSESAERPHYLAVGILGCYGFWGKVGKDANGNAVKGLIPDFGWFEFQGRTFILVYDPDSRTNPDIRRAMNKIASILTDKGATVLIASVPKIEGSNGIDDVLAHWATTRGDEAAAKKGLEIIKSAKAYTPEKATQADQLLELSEDIELFRTPDGEAYAIINHRGCVQPQRVRSTLFRDFLSYRFSVVNGKTPGNQALQDTIQQLCGKAIFEGEIRPVFLRHAMHEGKIYIDLCNNEYQILEIDVEGYRVISQENAPVWFKRTKAMTSLPLPFGDGDITKLKKYLNVDSKNLTLILAWLINSFRPDFPFPIALITGEQGTAKSTASKVMRLLIDPNLSPLRSSPRDDRDLAIAANNSCVIALDNLSSIPHWLSDGLCRVSTRSGLATRMLYTNDDEQIFDGARPIILNGIGDIASRPDLLDRSVLIKLEVIPENRRKTEREFWAEFEQDRCSIFTALVNAVSCALANIDDAKLEKLPRMADFAMWATAAESALGLESGEFMATYTENREDAHSIVLDDSSIFEAITKVCADRAPYECTMKELYELIEAKADDKIKQSKQFPKNARGLRSQIERINPNLRAIGISITFQKRTKAGSQILLEYVDQSDSEAPTSSGAGTGSGTDTSPAPVFDFDEEINSEFIHEYSDNASEFVDMEI